MGGFGKRFSHFVLGVVGAFCFIGSMSFLRSSSIAFLVASLFMAPVSGKQPKANVLIFFVDDMGWQDCSLPFYFENGKEVKTAQNLLYRTPNLEALGKQGIRFSQACAHPVCTPSRVALLTGQTPTSLHITNWTHPLYPQSTDQGDSKLEAPDWKVSGLDADVVTFPRIFQKAGYRTIHVGKAHFAPSFKKDKKTKNPASDPRSLGFDVNIAGSGNGGVGSFSSERHYGEGSVWHVKGMEHYYDKQTHLTQALTNEMCKQLDVAVASDQSFLAYMSHYAIHAPYEIDARYSKHYPELQGRPLGYATLIEGMDRSLGRLLNKLDELGVAEETLVIFMGDNGSESANMRKIPQPAAPLRGRKGTAYEGGSRVPLLISWAKPNAENPLQQKYPITAAAHSDDLVTIHDIFPTLMDFADLSAPRTPRVGKSLAPYLKGEQHVRADKTLLIHQPHKHNGRFFSTLRSQEWKILYFYETETWELYHLAEDVGEQHNLAHLPEHRSRLRRMAKALIKDLRNNKAQYPVVKDSGRALRPKMP